MGLSRTLYGLRPWTIHWAFGDVGQHSYLLRTVIYTGYPQRFKKRIWLNMYQQELDDSHIIIRCTWQGAVLWYRDTCTVDQYKTSRDAGTPDLPMVRC